MANDEKESWEMTDAEYADFLKTGKKPKKKGAAAATPAKGPVNIRDYKRRAMEIK